MKRVLILALVASFLAGCSDEEETATITETAATSTQPEPEPLTLEQTAEEWASLFGSGDKKACELMSDSYACETIYLRGDQPSGFVRSFGSAGIESVEQKGDRAAVIFSSGEGIELERLGDAWYVTNIGGNAGQRGP